MTLYNRIKKKKCYPFTDDKKKKKKLQKSPLGLLSFSISDFDSVIGSLLPEQSYRIGTISILSCYSNTLDSLDIISQIL